MHAHTDCVFCRIAAGAEPCYKVLETESVLCIMDIFPASDGHTLVIPRRHCETVFDISETDMIAVSTVTRRVAAAIRAELSPHGMTIAQVNGAAAGQTVMHYHVHLLPRTRGQAMALHGSKQADPARLETLAAAFAARL